MLSEQYFNPDGTGLPSGPGIYIIPHPSLSHGRITEFSIAVFDVLMTALVTQPPKIADIRNTVRTARVLNFEEITIESIV